ncbi:MAG: sigma-54-dependent Fis family transcriptional regulator [Vicingaceae bacterium]|jgi:transcriptional regulator with PAS, ATPase and Fis domain|nr:MAG: sigma-54-dependent Fis family transcriptional regulator [Vicingaceae bacterium]
MDLQSIKQRFGIIGNDPKLNRALEIAAQVAPTDLSVLITGESGTGKEIMPQIIHYLSPRKHSKYIAVNCGAIPEGTIDSELFGHEKGSFTGAYDSRKGYFEVADGGTIFLDEVAELPLETQVRLLRVLETGEFIRVGSSKVQKTNVRVVAATNRDLLQAIQEGKFREDLYFRLNTVPIYLPPLRERGDDILLLFKKFASDFSAKYRMPPIELTPEAIEVLKSYRWPGNIRQLKNVVEQISIIEHTREISPEILKQYLPNYDSYKTKGIISDFSTIGNEREILYKVLFEFKNEILQLKKIIFSILENNPHIKLPDFEKNQMQENQMPSSSFLPVVASPSSTAIQPYQNQNGNNIIVKSQEHTSHQHEVVDIEEPLSLEEHEKELIKKALEKYKGKRKPAAKELGISERTLYRKIKDYNLGHIK